MLETQAPGTEALNPQLDTIAITCPPLLGGGLSLKPTFKACGTWGSDAPMAQLQIQCQFLPVTGGASNGTVTMNANNTWSATFNIPNPLPRNGALKAVLIDNNVQTAQTAVPNLQVVATGGGTCTC